MKVYIPEFVQNSAISIFSVSATDGLLLTENPRGIIQYDDVNWYFYRNSHSEYFNIAKDSLSDFAAVLLKKYPDIQINYYPIES